MISARWTWRYETLLFSTFCVACQTLDAILLLLRYVEFDNVIQMLEKGYLGHNETFITTGPVDRRDGEFTPDGRIKDMVPMTGDSGADGEVVLCQKAREQKKDLW